MSDNPPAMTDDEPLRAYVREAMKLERWNASCIRTAESIRTDPFVIGVIAARLASADRDKLIARNAELVEAIRQLLPRNLNLANGNVPDDTTIPLDVTMGELRALATLSTGEA